ncbi:MAG: hypothetical protein RSA01_02485 [Clostridium sp.]|uniref:hypothetical protein n=1 Tax=Clostridium sp. TaxID=1506 RepID=UPI002FC795BF
MDVNKSIKLGIVSLIGVLSIHIIDLIFLFKPNDSNLGIVSFIHLIFYALLFYSGYSICKYTYKSVEGSIISLLGTFCCIISIYLDIILIIKLAFPIISTTFMGNRLAFIMLIIMHILLLAIIFLVIFFRRSPNLTTPTHMALLILLCTKSILLLLIALTPNIVNTQFLLIKVICDSIDCVILTLIIVTFKSFILALIKEKYSKINLFNTKKIPSSDI